MGKHTDETRLPKGAMAVDDILRMELPIPDGVAESRRTAPGTAVDPVSGRALKDMVGGVAQMLRDLEAQLARVMTINETLEKELQESRNAGRALAKERDDLAARLVRTEAEGGTIDDVRGEVLALQRERRQLVERLDAAEEQGRKAAAQLHGVDQKTERLVIERDEALEEVRCLEAQFGRAAEALLDLRKKNEDFAAQREQLAGRIRTLEGELGGATERGEELRAELEESRNAIEELRRSILEFGAHSQRLQANG